MGPVQELFELINSTVKLSEGVRSAALPMLAVQAARLFTPRLTYLGIEV